MVTGCCEFDFQTVPASVNYDRTHGRVDSWLKVAIQIQIQISNLRKFVLLEKLPYIIQKLLILSTESIAMHVRRDEHGRTPVTPSH